MLQRCLARPPSRKGFCAGGRASRGKVLFSKDSGGESFLRHPFWTGLEQRWGRSSLVSQRGWGSLNPHQGLRPGFRTKASNGKESKNLQESSSLTSRKAAAMGYQEAQEGSEARTAFRLAEKKYKRYKETATATRRGKGKRRNSQGTVPPTELSDVLDFRAIARTLGEPGGQDSLHGVQRVEGSWQWPVFSISGRPGFYFLPNALNPEQQSHLVAQSLTAYLTPPNRTNHNAAYGPIWELWESAQRGDYLVEASWHGSQSEGANRQADGAAAKEDPSQNASCQSGAAVRGSSISRSSIHQGLANLGIAVDADEADDEAGEENGEENGGTNGKAHMCEPANGEREQARGDSSRGTSSSVRGGGGEDRQVAVREEESSGPSLVLNGEAPYRESGLSPGGETRPGQGFDATEDTTTRERSSNGHAGKGRESLKSQTETGNGSKGGDVATCRQPGVKGEEHLASWNRSGAKWRWARRGPGGGEGEEGGTSEGPVMEASGENSIGRLAARTPGFSPGSSSGFSSGISVQGQVVPASGLLRKLRWATLGVQFDWAKRSYNPELPYNPFPVDLAELAAELAKPAMPAGQSFRAEAAIVNFYGPDDMLGGHVDDMEADWSKPIVSISLGCPAIFLLGGSTREEAPVAMLLRSGDVMLLAGPARRCFHGVPRIFLPEEGIGENCGVGDVPSFDGFASFMKSSRININVRQVW